MKPSSYNPTDGSVQGVLADKWEVDGSGRVYTFVLRKGLRFHHGEELTARMLNSVGKGSQITENKQLRVSIAECPGGKRIL